MEYIEKKDRIIVLDNEQEIGEVTWSQSEAIMIIDHTFVDATYRGQKIAETLVAHAVDRARREGLSVVPLCPYAKKEFDRKPQYHDVLKKDAGHHE